MLLQSGREDREELCQIESNMEICNFILQYGSSVSCAIYCDKKAEHFYRTVYHGHTFTFARCNHHKSFSLHYVWEEISKEEYLTTLILNE